MVSDQIITRRHFYLPPQVGTLGRKGYDASLRFHSPEDATGRVPLVLHVIADGVMGMDRQTHATVTVRDA